VVQVEIDCLKLSFFFKWTSPNVFRVLDLTGFIVEIKWGGHIDSFATIEKIDFQFSSLNFL
jgi:hypothetical protein